MHVQNSSLRSEEIVKNLELHLSVQLFSLLFSCHVERHSQSVFRDKCGAGGRWPGDEVCCYVL